MKNLKPPQFVMVYNTALRHVDNKYTCDNGYCDVDYEYRDNKIYCVTDIKDLNGIELTPTTEILWRHNVGKYAKTIYGITESSELFNCLYNSDKQFKKDFEKIKRNGIKFYNIYE